MAAHKIIFVSQEISPYLSVTENARWGRSLPQSIQQRKYEVRTFMPDYGDINERRNQLHEVIRLSGLNIPIDDNDHPLIIKVATLQPSRLQVYFIDNDDFFHHHASDALEIVNHPEDNDERIIFFSQGVVETVRKLRWYPQVIHCGGWITALCPLYIKCKYPDDPAFKDAKIVYSLMGEPFVGQLDPRMAEKLEMTSLPKEALTALAGEVDFNAINRIAIDHADAIVQSMEDVDPELIAYAKASGKPFLPFPGLDNVDAYAEFYDSL